MEERKNPSNYTLSDLFRDYRFNGVIWTKEGETSDFALDIFEYEGCSGTFVGSARDKRGLSSVVGSIKPETYTSAVVCFRRLFEKGKPIEFDCRLQKTDDDVFLRGSYELFP